ncbi:MAG TPA: two-component regulator propeller domain-containing protein [Terracidiphilus sp.]|nr:two-component regulator propeller domain-containing protein [Terracidiphilus sp.]
MRVWNPFKKHARVSALCAAATIVAAAGLSLVFYIRLQHSLRSAAAEANSAQQIQFESRVLSPATNVAVEWISSPAKWTSGAVYNGRIYLCGPTGLFEINADGTPARSFRPGLELPAAPLVALAVGTPRGATQPELLIATRGSGLLRFDGSTFVEVLPREAAARDVTAILPLSTGDVLLGTRKLGLLVYAGGARGNGSGNLNYLHPELSGRSITALAGDAGDLWAGTQDAGLIHFHGGTADTFASAQGLPDDDVTSLAVRGPDVYAGTPLGVAEFENGQLQRVLAKNYFAQALGVDDQSLTVGTVDEGIVSVPLDARTLASSLGPGIARRIRAEGAGAAPAPNTLAANAFFNTQDGPIAVTNEGLLEKNSAENSWRPVVDSARPLLTDSNISALAFAPDGALWIGYFDRGLDIAAIGGDIKKATHYEDEHIFCVNRILADNRNARIDVATANGLALFDEHGRLDRVLGRHDGLIAEDVTDVETYGDGLAIATPAGLTFLNRDGAESLYAFEGLVNNHVYALGVSQDRVLAGTLGGISLLQNKNVVRNFTVTNSALKHNWITALVPVGDQWFVGTYGAGVMRLGPDGQFAAFEHATRAMEVNFNAMLVTPSHVLAGTLSDGLYIYDRDTGRWRQWTAGLPSMNVTALAERDGEIYIGTDNGLVRVAERRLAQ